MIVDLGPDYSEADKLEREVVLSHLRALEEEFKVMAKPFHDRLIEVERRTPHRYIIDGQTEEQFIGVEK